MRRFAFIIIFSLAFWLFYFNISDAYEKEIKAISSALSEKISMSGKKSVAVVDFTDLQGNVTELGRFLAEEFSVALSESGKGFEVVDRTNIKSLLQEHQLALTGLIDPKTARKLGEIAGVHALITGTITPFGDSIRLAVKVLDTTTARVIGGSRGDIAKTKAIEELLSKEIDKIPAITPRTTSASPFPSSNLAKSKNVGNVTVTFKQIAISKQQILLAFDFFNKSISNIKLAINANSYPYLIDNEGNKYRYSGGVYYTYPGNFGDDDGATTLYSQSRNDVVFNFVPEGYGIKVGTVFELSLPFMLYDIKSKSKSVHQVSFSDIKAKLTR